MKIFSAFSFALICSFPAAAQPAGTCDSLPTATHYLTGNAVSALITNGGDLWFDGDDAAYIVSEPADSTGLTRSASGAIAGGLWLAGKDPEENILVAAPQYSRWQGEFDYGPGPLTTEGNTVDNCADWDKMWPISRQEVQDFLNDFDPSAPNSAAIPSALLAWPGTGNPHFTAANGFQLPTTPQGYAPFFDANLDGIYNPYNGDYPAFCGDQAVWTVFNDNRPIRPGSLLRPLQFEVHLLAYSFTAPDNDPLQRTTFYDYTIINRRQESISELYIGSFIDFDVGCFTDDHVGSSPENNLVYAHNINEQDGDPCLADYPAFSTPGVVQLAQVLRSTAASSEVPLLSSATMMINNGIGVPPPEITSPSFAQEHYNFMTGLWRDGTPMTRGGIGLDEEGDTTRYVLDGGPTAENTPWIACTEFNFPAADEQMVIASGPYQLSPGQTARYTMAMTTVFNVPYDSLCPDMEPAFSAARAVKTFYDDNCSDGTLTATDDLTKPAKIDLEAFPNPTTNHLTFRLPPGHTIAALNLYGATGRRVLRTTPQANQMTVRLADKGLLPGVYFYRLRTQSGAVVSGKVLLMR